MDNHNRELTAAVYERLGTGVYELEITQKNCLLYSTLDIAIPVSEYVYRLDNNHFILEKRNGDAVLLFPDVMVQNKPDFLDDIESYTDIIHRFESVTNCKKAAVVVCNQCTISGLASSAERKMHTSEFSILGPSFRFQTLTALEEEYAAKELDRYMQGVLKRLTPEAMLSYCENRIQGQGIQLKRAVYLIYRYLQDIAMGTSSPAENWIMTAPSGSGKTEFFRTIRDLFRLYHVPIPVVQIDLSQITEVGYKGNNMSYIPQQILLANPKLDGVGICFLDEADKKCIPSYSRNNVNTNEAIQANLLTLIEGAQLTVEVNDDSKAFDSCKTMFVLMGSFQNIRNDKQKKRDTSPSLGFGSDFTKTASVDNVGEDFYEDLTMQDLIDFGMLEELAGRMVQLINFHRLSQEQMRKLIACKTKEIADSLGIEIEMTGQAEEELLDISFGSLGLRRPMNAIRELALNAIAEVFFENGFDAGKDKVVIQSLTLAKIKRSRHSHANCNEK